MIYKLDNIGVLISKIARDLNMGDSEIPWQSMVEWVAEGLKEIGVYYQFTHKQATITIDSYTGELPCDFYSMVRILGSTLFDPNDLISYNGYLIGDSDATIQQTSGRENEYKINFNIITTGFKTGSLDIQYLAFPVDTDGFPMVPDNEEYRKALFWKVAYQLGIQGYTFKAKQLNNLDFTGRKWSISRMSARAEGNMPDPMMYERLKNQWMRLITSNNDFNRKFMYTDKSQSLNFDGSF